MFYNAVYRNIRNDGEFLVYSSNSRIEKDFLVYLKRNHTKILRQGWDTALVAALI